jgi:hypothetical protein
MPLTQSQDAIPILPFQQYKKNIYSQFGEDGLLAHFLNQLKITNGYFVEFGAWDGRHLSNCAHLISQGWQGCFVEGDKNRFDQLHRNYEQNPAVRLVNEFVTPTGDSTLDIILQKNEAPSEFDVLSIDIDGNDYHIWSSLEQHVAKICIVEFNPTIPAALDYVQPIDQSIQIGSSLLSLWRLAQTKGYELVATTDVNAIFILSSYCDTFKILTYQPAEIKDPQYEMQIFQAYDGTLIFQGMTKLLWHGIDINRAHCQVLPANLRKYPDGQDVQYYEQLQAFIASIKT